MEDWTLTANQKMLNFTQPKPTSVLLDDIIWVLPKICRFNGHTTCEHYSVAEHSIHVASLVPDEFKFMALLHDATEAYMGDCVSPLKALLPRYRAIEAEVWRRAIAPAFNLPERLPDCIMQADLQMLALEARDVMPKSPEPWKILEGVKIPPNIHIHAWDSLTARSRFRVALDAWDRWRT